MLFSAYPNKTQALIPVHDLPGYILDGLKFSVDFLRNLALGAPGSGAATRAALKGAKKPCDAVKTAYQASQAADVFPGAEVLGGNSVQIGKLTAKITALQTLRTCYISVLALEEAPGALAGVLGGLQAESAAGFNELILENAINALDQRIDKLVELRSNAIKAMWKAVAVKVLITAENKFVTNVVNDIIRKYKVSNFLDYGDALTTQIYNIEYAQKNYPNQVDQAIIKSVWQSDPFQGELSPILSAQASENLGFDPTLIDYNDPAFFVKMAQAGSMNNTPDGLNVLYNDAATVVRAQAKANAQAEISQGQGVMALRNCSGIASQERRFDSDFKAKQDDLALKQAAYQKLWAAQISDPSSVDPQDLQRALNNLNQAKTALAALPKRNSDVFVKRCEDISNPASAINNFTNTFLSTSLIGSKFKEPENLSFAPSAVGAFSSLFLDKLIGVTKGRSLGTRDFEDMALTTSGQYASDLSLNILRSAENSTKNNSLFLSVASAGSAGRFVINWDASALEGGSRITITGTGSGALNYSAQSLKGSITIQSQQTSGSFTLKVFDSANKELASEVANIPAVPNLTLGSPQNPDLSSSISNTNTSLITSGLIPTPPPSSEYTCNGQYISYNECLLQHEPNYCAAICGGVNGANIKSPEFLRGSQAVKIRGN